MASNLDIHFNVRSYRICDRPAVRTVFGADEFARPQLAIKYPCMSEYVADESSYYYTNFEPESLFVAVVEDRVEGALLGALDTFRYEQYYDRKVRPYLAKRCLTGAYGCPGWLIPVIRTELDERKVVAPRVNRREYPAHLHIGILPNWRRRGIGTALMAHFTDYLRQRGIPGFHLYASSFHLLGIAFYHKLGLENLGEFTWRLHNGHGWSLVTEHIFGRRLI